jgi:hypothetical protein
MTMTIINNEETTTTMTTTMAPLPKRSASCSSISTNDDSTTSCTVDNNKLKRRHSFSDLQSLALLHQKQQEEFLQVLSPEVIVKEEIQGNNHYRLYARKAGVAVAGTTLTAMGLVMIPLPVPLGAAVTGAGMSVLGSEFPVAQRMMDSTSGAIRGAFHRTTTSAKKRFVAIRKQRVQGTSDDTVVLESIPAASNDESLSSNSTDSQQKEQVGVFATCVYQDTAQEIPDNKESSSTMAWFQRKFPGGVDLESWRRKGSMLFHTNTA